MTRLVLDCSVAVSWCFEDEGDSYSTDILTALAISEAVVPCIWPLEVANVLLVAERRNRLKAAESSRFLSLLGALPIAVEAVAPARILDKIVSLGRQQNLSAYDAAYLELAMREGLPIATLDEHLREAAEALGVGIAGLAG